MERTNRMVSVLFSKSVAEAHDERHPKLVAVAAGIA